MGSRRHGKLSEMTRAVTRGQASEDPERERSVVSLCTLHKPCRYLKQLHVGNGYIGGYHASDFSIPIT